MSEEHTINRKFIWKNSKLDLLNQKFFLKKEDVRNKQWRLNKSLTSAYDKQLYITLKSNKMKCKILISIIEYLRNDKRPWISNGGKNYEWNLIIY